MSDQVVELKPKTGRPRKTEFTRLTKKQHDFVDLVCTKEGQLTLREIASQAGYASSGSHTRAYELLNPRLNPHVVAAVKRKREELNERYSVDYGRHIRDLQKLRDEAIANNAWSAAVMAERLRGQAAGLYVSRSEIRIGSIDTMSKQEVEAALEEIKKSMGAEKIIEGETVEARSDVLAGNEDGTEGDGPEDSPNPN